MVNIESKKIVITINDNFPAERWNNIVEDLLNLIAIANKDLVDNNTDCIQGVADLIKEMMPILK